MPILFLALRCVKLGMQSRKYQPKKIQKATDWKSHKNLNLEVIPQDAEKEKSLTDFLYLLLGVEDSGSKLWLCMYKLSHEEEAIKVISLPPKPTHAHSTIHTHAFSRVKRFLKLMME